MSTEPRVMAPQTKIGSRPTGGGAAEAEEAAPAKKGGNKMMLIVVGVLVLIIAGGAWYFLMGPGAGGSADAAATDAHAADAAATPEPSYTLGEVMTVDSISINLEGGHYLRLGLGLQLVEGAGAHAPIDTAKALDAAIALYSGHTQEELADPAIREELKQELATELLHLYHEEVVDVYYTDFVTQ